MNFLWEGWEIQKILAWLNNHWRVHQRFHQCWVPWLCWPLWDHTNPVFPSWFNSWSMAIRISRFSLSDSGQSLAAFAQDLDSALDLPMSSSTSSLWLSVWFSLGPNHVYASCVSRAYHPHLRRNNLLMMIPGPRNWSRMWLGFACHCPWPPSWAILKVCIILAIVAILHWEL